MGWKFLPHTEVNRRRAVKDARINRQAKLRACTGANGGGTIPEGKKAGNDADLPPGRANGLATEQELTLPMTVPDPSTPNPGCTVNKVSTVKSDRNTGHVYGYNRNCYWLVSCATAKRRELCPSCAAKFAKGGA